MSTIDVWSDELRQQLLAALAEHAPSGVNTEPHLRGAIAEMLARPGKLVRARLAFATVTAHGGDADTALALATAIEYYHIASLLLDDLPCMDNAAIRRGRVCVHHVHGEATAILAALAFINRAYALVGFAMTTQPGLVRLRAQACLDACLGAAGLLGGQARDLQFAGSDRSAREVSRIALGKTGAMLWLGLVLPGLLAAPEPTERRLLEALCAYWSLAFQALDDVQDVLGTSIVEGKTTGRDRALQRPNLAVVLGVPATRRRIARLLMQSDRTVARLTARRSAWRYLEQFQRYFAEAAAPVAPAVANAAA